jgi:hypothetical protein
MGAAMIITVTTTMAMAMTMTMSELCLLQLPYRLRYQQGREDAGMSIMNAQDMIMAMLVNAVIPALTINTHHHRLRQHCRHNRQS